MIFAALFTLLTIFADGRAEAMPHLGSKAACEDAASVRLYGATVAAKATHDRAEAERMRGYRVAVGAWRASHRCSIYMSDDTTYPGVVWHWTRDEFGEIVDGPSWVVPRKTMTCSVPGGRGERWFMRKWEGHAWELEADEFYGTGVEVGDGAVVLRDFDVKSATCLREDDR